MKKLTLALCVCLMMLGLNTASAQVCVPVDTFSEAGLFPIPDSLPCIDQGVAQNQTIYFRNFKDVGPVTIESLTIDSLTNLPCGLSWAADRNPPFYEADSFGCIQVTGTTTDSAGQYKLGIWVTIVIGGQPISGEAGDLASQFGAGDFSYWVRVKAPNDACPAIDTLGTNDLTASGLVCVSNVRELTNVSSFEVSPNPFNATATVSFYGAEAAEYTATIYSMAGKEVRNFNIQVANGYNTLSIERGDLSSGVYFFTISDGARTATHKLVIAD